MLLHRLFVLRDSRIQVSQSLIKMGGGGHCPRPLRVQRTSSIQGEFAMKRIATAALGAVLLSLVGAGIGLAQVKRVEMKIDGYLCGN